MTRRRVAVSMALDQPFRRHVAVYSGIQDYAGKRGDWQLVVDDWADRLLPARPGREVPFDGIVGRISRAAGARARRAGIPAVNVHYSAAGRDQMPGVFTDFATCGRLRAGHLLARGFRNFGVLTHANDRAAMTESESFDKSVRDAGCPKADRLVLRAARGAGRQGVGDCDLSAYNEWHRAMRDIDRWMDGWRYPIGLFIFNVALARVVIQKCTARGRRVPEEVAIIAGWNEELLCECGEPTITSIELPYERIGWEAARMLDELMTRGRDGRGNSGAPDGAPATIWLPPVGIVERQSTDFHAVDDELVRRALAYMGVHLHRRVLIDEVAAHLAVSRVTLTTRFRRSLGRTINEELRRLRVERVKRDLTGSDKPVRLIARAAGFGCVRSLNLVFRELENCTPAQYRMRTSRNPRRTRTKTS